MAIEYLLVTFPEQRAVLTDGAGVGFTNHILMLPGDEYEITLQGNSYTPASRVIALAGTSMIKPMVISFDLVAAAAVARSAVSAPEATPATPPAAKRARAPARATAAARKKTKKISDKKPVTQRGQSTAGKSAAVKTATKVKNNA